MSDHGVIDTDRLTLRPHRRDDYEAMVGIFTDPAVFRFLGGMPMSREDVWHRLLRYAGHWSLFGYGLFAIVEKATGRFLGETGFADFHRGLGDQFDSCPEAAWILGGAFHGKGLATEAVAAAHRWFDRRARPSRTVCIIRADNVGSIRLAEKINYERRGRAEYRDASVLVFHRDRISGDVAPDRGHAHGG